MLKWFDNQVNHFMWKDRFVKTKKDAVNVGVRGTIFVGIPFMLIWTLFHLNPNNVIGNLSIIPFMCFSIAGGVFMGFMRYFNDREVLRNYNALVAERDAVIVDPNIRWEKGIEHHPKSVEIYNYISKADFEHGDFFEFKAGGDGDNGEQLMYLLDSYFEKKDIL